MNEQQDKIVCADGVPISVSVYLATESKGVVVMGSALGIPQQFYKRYVTYLCEHHWDCITFDYRGTGESKSDKYGHAIRLEDWGIQDIDAVLGYAQSLAEVENRKKPVHYIGHSIGGQLVGLSKRAQDLTSIVHIAVSSPYWRRWPFPGSAKIALVAKVLIPLAALGRRDFPTKELGLGSITVPSSCVRQWAQWMSHPDYLFAEKFNIDTDNFSTLHQPLLALGFDDDDLAPEENIDEILKHFPATKVEKVMLKKTSLMTDAIGHSGFFKEKGRAGLWPITLSWIIRNK